MDITGFFCVTLSYFFGAIPFGLLLTAGRGVDIREQGSKNIGATNVSRIYGKQLGLLTLLLDIGKGFLPMFVAAQVIGDHPQSTLIIALCGGAAVVGHMFPVYLRFRGGKGVATGLGVFMYLAPLAVLMSMAIFIAVVGLSGFVSMGSLVGSASIIVGLLLLGEPTWKLWLSTVIVSLIWIKHGQNIRRLFSGTEKSWKKKEETPCEP